MRLGPLALEEAVFLKIGSRRIDKGLLTDPLPPSVKSAPDEGNALCAACARRELAVHHPFTPALSTPVLSETDTQS